MEYGRDIEKVIDAIGTDLDENVLKQILHALEKDDLTNLYTKQAFYYKADELLSENTDKNYDLILADVENFKLINRLYGRNSGDNILKYLAERYSELSKDGVCGRYDGDRFAMLIPSVNDEETENFYSSIDKIRELAPIPYITIRYGIYRHVDRKDSIADMCDKAVMAIGCKKNFHDDPICLYDRAVIQKNIKTQTYESRFEQALDNNEFVVWCQPKYNTNNKVMSSAEALVRWITSEGEFINPGEFIPVFESDGLIAKLDEYVFNYVCMRQKEIMDSGKEPIPISVNMSRVTLFNPGEIDRYKEIIETANIPKRLVPIEITESATTGNGQIKTRVDELKSAGFILHMDDFGSGYSSLSNISSFKFDAVKLDKSLIDGIGTPRGEEVIRHIVGMSHFFMMEVIAEGVEQRAQYTFLKKLGCDTIQGYYFSKPVPFDTFIEMCEQHPMIKGNAIINFTKDDRTDDVEDENDYAQAPSGKKINIFKRIADFSNKFIKGEVNDNYRSNMFTMKCMWMSMMVMLLCWVLDVFNIFIVDMTIMTSGLLMGSGVSILAYIYACMFGIDRPHSRYVLMTAIVLMYSSMFMELSYHVTLVMTFPLICSMMYFDRRVTLFTYIATCIGYAGAVMLGFRIGLCDSNMLLLTYTNSAFHSAALATGDFTINDNGFLMFLFFVFPRWLLLAAIMPLLYMVANDVQFRTKREAKIRHMAELDGLTGVSNRYKYVQDINNYYPSCDTVGVLYFDLNNLKFVNDNKGHESGDKLICALSEEMLKYESDRCKSYRIGGDEFVMIIENEETKHIENYRRNINSSIQGKAVDEDVKLSVAIGMAIGAGKEVENIIKKADEDMYQTKLEMKNGMR